MCMKRYNSPASSSRRASCPGCTYGRPPRASSLSWRSRPPRDGACPAISSSSSSSPSCSTTVSSPPNTAEIFQIQTTYKPVVYSIKLKIEFVILNELIAFTQTGRRHDQFFHTETDEAPRSSLLAGAVAMDGECAFETASLTRAPNPDRDCTAHSGQRRKVWWRRSHHHQGSAASQSPLSQGNQNHRVVYRNGVAFPAS
ncbi:uncharacterized protein B0I36DRAFT_134462 [Microdochium trichocladiopsis]|uniref:DUF7703 domain-containing protein n=1 Tax=Microdochium trichocladiopsis TaxID=1682393 RepID=A0A9P9BPV5_9PEZI|nr:uncharacterized protein B0I36DRAFT_134462 [Microdochium trichocladiopsis]KAH7029637.1 hypothetical protein B0I36DRAFT_134462 [Microdochium trichocladiopsis]